MDELIGAPPILVAHRGYSGKYPENTLLSYKKAYQYGARYMELDLQLTSDCIPVLHHDVSLLRMAGVDTDIRETTAKQFMAMPAAYMGRFGDKFIGNKFTTFKKFCKWLKRHPQVTIFVEIKQESIDYFGFQVFVDAVSKCILSAGVESQCVIISFNHEVVKTIREISTMRSGWVLPKWSEENKVLLHKLDPDFLFCDKQLLPLNDDEIWRGNWQWAIYNLDDVESATAMANRGMPFLETNQIGTLMSDASFSNRA